MQVEIAKITVARFTEQANMNTVLGCRSDACQWNSITDHRQGKCLGQYNVSTPTTTLMLLLVGSIGDVSRSYVACATLQY